MTKTGKYDEATRAKFRVAREHGILQPRLAWRASQAAGLPYWAACAFLMQETSGGRNVWGHDPTWMVGFPVLNKDTYSVYKTHRSRFGSQGVGPMQLTYHAFQDQADSLGGCWDPYVNMVVGFGLIANYAETSTWREAARRYNGSGPAAEAYADRMVERFKEWRGWLRDA